MTFRWALQRLGDIATLKMGGTPSTGNDEYWVNGNVLWATPGDLGRDELIRVRDTTRKMTTTGLAAKRTELFPRGTILLSTTATIGNIGIADCPTYCNQQITAIIPNVGLSSEYLAYFLLRSKSSLMRLGGTSTATHINQKNLSTLSIPIAPLSEQRRIVDVLSRAEGIVRLRRDAEKKAAELIPALFFDMFGDPATNPKGWQERKLGDVAEVVSGVTKGRKFGDKQTVVVPYLRVANVQAGHVDLAELKTIEVLPRDVEQLALQRGDVVMTEGGDFDKLGRGALWEQDIPNCIHQNHIFRVRLNQSLALPEFFVTYLQSGKTRSYFLRCAKRTTNLASINMTQLRGLPVLLPSIDLQSDFLERFNAMRSIQSQQAAATAKSQATFDALLAQVFG